MADPGPTSIDLIKGEAQEGAEEEEEEGPTGMDATFVGGETAEKIATQQEQTMNAWVDQQLNAETGGKNEGEEEKKEAVDIRAELFEAEEGSFKEVLQLTLQFVFLKNPLHFAGWCYTFPC